MAVFVILFVLSEVVRLVGIAFENKEQKPKPQQTGNSFSDLAYFKQRDQRDLIIITAIMKNKGHEAPLNIERIN